ncbi:hypothetical protein [Halopenitus sp. POP-27]|uniref:hypothetical protein n=1 Tax=Halopenitus sp. POP-27 TaxID=2994425 RepID=UPI002469B928|nr:hypothetical protein [Halopenitus sp. POP-27]
MPTLVKWLSLLVIVTSLSAIVFGTGAFSAVTADRIGEIDAASDESALLGIDIEDRSIRTNQEVVLATLTNRFDTDIESLSVQVADDGGFNRVRIAGTPDSLAPGESADVHGRIVCGPQSSGTVVIAITAEGSFGSVELTRPISIDCATGGPVCTPSDDDRIGDREFIVEEEFFECSIEIDANQYRVGLEETTIAGDFDLTANGHRTFAVSESDIGGVTTVLVQNNVQSVDIESTSFGGPTTIEAGRNLNGDVSVESSTFGGDTEIRIGSNAHSVKLSETTVNGDLRIVIDGNLNDDLSIEDVDVSGDIEVAIAGNSNGDITVEGSEVDGSVDVTVDGTTNGDVTVSENDVSDDVLATIGALNSGLTISENDVGSDIDATTAQVLGGGEVTIEGNTVGGESPADDDGDGDSDDDSGDDHDEDGDD